MLDAYFLSQSFFLLSSYAMIKAWTTTAPLFEIP